MFPSVGLVLIAPFKLILLIAVSRVRLLWVGCRRSQNGQKRKFGAEIAEPEIGYQSEVWV